jgi:hypothetical protein
LTCELYIKKEIGLELLQDHEKELTKDFFTFFFQKLPAAHLLKMGLETIARLKESWKNNG